MRTLNRPAASPILIVLTFSLLMLTLAGCSAGTGVSPITTSPSPATGSIAGVVHGGQSPIVGSVIQLYAVGTTGYGSTPTALITSTYQSQSGVALTDSNGNFNLSTTNFAANCPSTTSLIYLTATGGYPGGGTSNSAISLMYIVGACNTFTSSSPSIVVNEVSTVVGAYALAQFMDPATGNVGSYSGNTSYTTNSGTTSVSNTLGITNAFSIPSTLYNSSTGLAYSTSPTVGAVVPQAEIYTLANILAGCVNSSGSGSTGCSQLFTATTIGSSAPTNTLTAILSIALHPGNKVSTLCPYAGTSAPFQSALNCSSPAPTDFMLAVGYPSGAVTPIALAMDSGAAASSPKLWINDFGTSGTGARFLRLNTYNGATFGTYNSNTSGVDGFSIENQGTGVIWGINRSLNTVRRYNLTGSNLSGPFNLGNSPRSVAFDLSADAWFTNATDNTVTVIAAGSSSNSTVGTSTAGAGGLNSPRGIAFDSYGNAWVANHSGSISELSLSGSTFTGASGSPFSGGGLGTPSVIAIDGSNNIWVGSDGGSTAISEFNNTGTPVSSTGYSDPTGSSTSAITFDGSGNLWSANLGKALVEFGPTGSVLSPSTGYTATTGYSSSLLTGIPSAIAIDQSGSIWVTTGATTTINSVTGINLVQFVGAAAPAIQPLSLALKNGQVNQRPGTPIPITITTTVLPYYTPGSAYSAQVNLSGGSGSYTWSISSGSLPSPMSLAGTGIISGTSSVSGTSTFTVKVADTANPSNFATKSLTLTSADTLPATGTNNSELNGSYAIQISGLKGGSTSTSGAVTGFGALGSLTFSGTGNITGTMDYNGAAASGSQLTVTGYYYVGSDNRGAMVITGSTTGLLPSQIEFSIGNISSSVAQSMRLQEFDYTGLGTGTALGISSGVGKLQTTAAFTSGTIGQTFVFGADGESPCSTCNGTVSPYGSISVAGRFVNSGGTTTGEEDAAAINTSYPGITLAGSYSTTPNATTGRGTIVLTPTGTIFPAPPTNYVYYIVNSGELLLLSTDAHTSTSLLIGDALMQSGSFSNATANGTYIAYEGSPTNGNGTSSFPNAMNLNLLSLVYNGSGTVTSVLEDNSNNGTVTLESLKSTSLPYSIDANGRELLLSGGGSLPIFYLSGPTGGFGTEQPTSGNTPGLLITQLQTGSSFTCSSLSGTYFLGTGRTVTEASTSTGYITFTGSGTGSGTVDSSVPNGLLANGTATSETCATDSYSSTLGRLKLTNGSGQPRVAYVISPSSFVYMDATTGSTTPSLTILQH